MIVGVPGQIRTGKLPNINRKRCRLMRPSRCLFQSQPLDDAIMASSVSLLYLDCIVVVIVVFSFCVECSLCVYFVYCVSFDRCVILYDVCYFLYDVCYFCMMCVICVLCQGG
jgi:hypothetical protein